MEYNIVIAGIGGQGVLTIARIIGEAALLEGLKVRVGEIHGLSQRFGSLFAHVRMGNSIYSGLIPLGKGDMLLSLEPAEALRHLQYMKKGAILILNRRPIEPPQVSMELFKYPSLEQIRAISSEKFGLKVLELDAREIAEKAGNAIAQNSVMLGAALSAPGIPISTKSAISALERTISRRFVDLNVRALELGMQEGRKLLEKVF
ncbi:MAG: indolepyruvate ferredoxin oxidoreductase subunit beta [Fervidicoccaceae archaeon]